jgi:hypothetical protein
LILN